MTDPNHDQADDPYEGDHLEGSKALEAFEKVHGKIDDAADDGAPEPDRRRKSAATILVDVAHESYAFGQTAEGQTFAVPKPDGHVVRMLRGGKTSLRAELAREFHQREGRPAGQQPLADAMLVLEGEAQQAPPVPVNLRVAARSGAVWIDLGDVQERAVRVDGNGWRVVTREVPVVFKRTALTGVLPVPEGGGSLDELWDLVNVDADDRPLVLAWLVAALADPEIPHPVLALHGEQGTGKSSASRSLVQLVDPSPVPLRKAPREVDGWVTAASGSWVVALDNLSGIVDWLSDSLCRASTGEGDVRRQLYTDADLAVFAFRRVILLNGIDLGALRGDLADRTLLVNLATIPEERRRTEAQLAAAWRAAHPRILGALLDEVANVLRVRPSIHLDASPRMADFGEILAALDEVHGTHSLERYTAQSRGMAVDLVTSHPFLAALIEKISDRWDGKAADLLRELDPGDDVRRPKDWPRSARAVTTLLRRNAPALRRVGWQVIDGVQDNVTTWTLLPPEVVRILAPVAPLPMNPQVSGQISPSRTAPASPVANPDAPSPNPVANPDAPASPGVDSALTRANEATGQAGQESGPPQVASSRCPECGEPATARGLTERCRSTFHGGQVA